MKGKEIFYSAQKSLIFKDLGVDFIVTSSLGGVSKPPYASLNLAYHVHDNPLDVRSNRAKIQQLFYPHKPLLHLNQIHSSRLLSASQTHKSEQLLGDGDGILCHDASLKALIMMADCAGVLLYDASSHGFALLHAGRAGTLKQICTKALQSQSFHTKADRIFAYISPCIHSCCYEIAPDLAQNLAAQIPSQALIQKETSFYLDLPLWLESELLAAGIPSSQIEISPACTCCSHDLYSYRRATKSGSALTGRFGLLASLKS